MAASMWRSAVSTLRRFISFTSFKRASDTPSTIEDIHQGKFPIDGCEIPDSLGHSVGKAREEALKLESGNDDPFLMQVYKRDKGTFDEPTILYSEEKKVMTGCICEEDSLFINWMNVYKGEPKRCECGHWFKVVSPPKHCDELE